VNNVHSGPVARRRRNGGHVAEVRYRPRAGADLRATVRRYRGGAVAGSFPAQGRGRGGASRNPRRGLNGARDQKSLSNPAANAGAVSA
jgi:hypothetical protein